jgi:CheY-like chemotaxis protein
MTVVGGTAFDATAATTRVLIVDDDDDAADALGMTLECFGHDVVLARSGPEAFERLASSSSPGAALIDLSLPVMNGFEVARRLRASHPTTILVALTGFGDEESRRAAAQAGFHEYILKPISGRDLDALLRSALRASR